jgi:hypothetical protein
MLIRPGCVTGVFCSPALTTLLGIDAMAPVPPEVPWAAASCVNANSASTEYTNFIWSSPSNGLYSKLISIERGSARFQKRSSTVASSITLLRPLVKAIDRFSLSEQASEATYEVHVITDANAAASLHDTLLENLNAANTLSEKPRKFIGPTTRLKSSRLLLAWRLVQ